MWNTKKIKVNLPLVCILVNVCILFYWVWMLSVTQPATSYNTHQCQDEIIGVEIKLASHRGNDKLYIITHSNTYMLDTGWQDRVRSQELANNILSINAPVIVTVWKHLPKWLFDLDGISWKVEQIVDLRSDCNVFWDILDHNIYQKCERAVGVVAGLIISMIIGLFDLLVWRGTIGARR